MSGYGESAGPHGRESMHVERSPISIGWVVLAALLCGAGIFLLWLWLQTGDWLYFSGIVPVIGGTIMFLNERAGLDHA